MERLACSLIWRVVSAATAEHGQGGWGGRLTGWPQPFSLEELPYTWWGLSEKTFDTWVGLLNKATFFVFPVFHLLDNSTQRWFRNIPPPPLTFFIWNGQEVTSVPYGVQWSKTTTHSVSKALSPPPLHSVRLVVEWQGLLIIKEKETFDN